jgi:ATP-dependent Clp protease ATP-binding subunit ClpB
MAKLSLLNPTKTGRQAQDLENKLRHLVVGQEEAIREIVRAYQTYLAGLASTGRPIGNFLFLGPTGSGKTRIVKATAHSLLNTSRAVIKIDCAELQHSHEIAKLIGSPPGYLGHRETHAMLSQEILNQHHTEDVKISIASELTNPRSKTRTGNACKCSNSLKFVFGYDYAASRSAVTNDWEYTC